MAREGRGLDTPGVSRPAKSYNMKHALLEVPCTYLVRPHHIRRRARFITFDLPQPPLGNVVVAGTAIGPMEHKGENKCSNIMAYRGGALKHVEHGMSALRSSTKTARILA